MEQFKEKYVCVWGGELMRKGMDGLFLLLRVKAEGMTPP